MTDPTGAHRPFDRQNVTVSAPATNSLTGTCSAVLHHESVDSTCVRHTLRATHLKLSGSIEDARAIDVKLEATSTSQLGHRIHVLD
jgi:hypothetical protein